MQSKPAKSLPYRLFFTLEFCKPRHILFSLACMVTLTALLVAEENFRGKRAWENYRHEHEARGEYLDLQHFIPPPVTDENNFAMTPLLAGLFEKGPSDRDALDKALKLPAMNGNAKLPSLGDRATGKRLNLDDWQAYFGGQEVLTALHKFEPQLTEISAAAKRPDSRFPVHYEKTIGAELPHLSVLRSLQKIYALRAVAELRAGRSEAALADVQTVFRLADSLKSEPLLISQLVRNAIFQTGLQAVWEGLADHRWSETQLQALQGDLGKKDFIEGLLASLRGERAFGNENLLLMIKDPKMFAEMLQSLNGDKNHLLQFIPRCVGYQNLLAADRLYDGVLSKSDPVALLQCGAQFDAWAKSFQKVSIRNFNPYTALAVMLVPAMGACITKSVYAQVCADEAMTACALERYRLANGHYPAALENLVPGFLNAVPRDAAGGGTLHYRLKDGGQFLLYSIGSDGQDDGGKVVLKDGRLDLKQGDWVW
jgi:hypothetical protein